MSTNSLSVVSQILASRYISGPVFSNTKTTTVKLESKPIQSSMEVGALWINNDRTHLEGVWNIKTGSIETGELTTDAPKYTATEKTERKG